MQLRPATGDFRRPSNLKVAGHKSITVTFFVKRWFRFQTMMDLIMIRFFHKIWHSSVLTRINYISIFFCIYLKDTWKNFVVNVWTIYGISIARCRVQYYMNMCCKHLKHFEWKRLRIANNTAFNGEECTSRTLRRF